MTPRMSAAAALAGLVAFAATAPPAGGAPSATTAAAVPAITNGEPAAGHWRFTAALVPAGDPDPELTAFCGAAVVARHWVVTAAHCVSLSRRNSPDLRARRAGSFQVVAGRYDVTGSQGQRLDVERVAIHPGYDAGRNPRDDIALVRVAGVLSPAPILLARPAQDPAPGDRVRAYGWGCMRVIPPNDVGTCLEPGALSATLNQVDLTARGMIGCRDIYEPTGRATYPARQLCASDFEPVPRDTCTADSGGPLTRRVGGRKVLVGVVSWGAGCGWKPYPGIYSKVSHYRPWLRQTMRTSSGCGPRWATLPSC